MTVVQLLDKARLPEHRSSTPKHLKKDAPGAAKLPQHPDLAARDPSLVAGTRDPQFSATFRVLEESGNSKVDGSPLAAT